MVTVSDIVTIMENWAPTVLAESWDNVGLLTGNPDQTIESVIIALDVSEKTLDLSLQHKPSMIISHHPMIFQPLKRFTDDGHSTSLLRKAIKKDIACYAAHTNLDQVPDGVSCALAESLNLFEISPLNSGKSDSVKFVTFCPPEYTDSIHEAAGKAGAGNIGKYSLCSFTSQGAGTYIPASDAAPYTGTQGEISRISEDKLEMIVPSAIVAKVIEEVRRIHPYEEMAYDIIPLARKNSSFGYGAMGKLPKPMKANEVIRMVSETLGCTSLRVSASNNKPIQRIAVMGGSGRHYIDAAISAGADAFISGDMGYHDFLENSEKLLLIDASHRATELPVLGKIREHLLSLPKMKHLQFVIDHGTPPYFDINEFLEN